MATAEEKSQECSALEQKIIRQIEFYFGDKNLSKDKFLLEQIKKDNGWVPFSVLTTFNRLKQLSSDQGVISTALKKSSSGLLEVGENNSRVRRDPQKQFKLAVELTTEERLDEISRSVYVKGFPADTTLDQLEEFFESYGKVVYITMRKFQTKERKFKGSVFVVFQEKVKAVEFEAAKDSIKFKDVDLQIEFRKDYEDRKAGQRNGANKQEEQKEQEDKENEEAEEPKPLRYKKGCVLKFEGCQDGTSIRALKDFFQPFGTVAFVDFPKEGGVGHVRFAEEEQAAVALKTATDEAEGGVVKINESEVTLTVLEGDEEDAYQKIAFEAAARKRAEGPKRGGFRGGRGGRGGKRGGYAGRGGKRSRSERDGEPQAKQPKE